MSEVDSLYTLNCDKCGRSFKTKNASPEPQLCIDCYRHENFPVEPVQLEVLGEKEIRYKLELIQPEGFNWADATETEMIKFKAISQATIAHNEAKGHLYRRIDGH